jgi:uncharacterized protein YxjI
MHTAFQFDQYLMKRQVFALTGKLRFYNPTGQLALFCEQKMFKLREDIRLYADEKKTEEVLLVKARNIVDFAAAYDVMDPASGQKIGVLRRKGWKSMFRDEWQVLDANDQQVGLVFEDSAWLAFLRRALLGSWLPQNYDMTLGNQRVADLKQRFNPFAYQMDVDFSMDTARVLDHRIGIAAAALLAIIEGRQS